MAKLFSREDRYIDPRRLLNQGVDTGQLDLLVETKKLKDNYNHRIIYKESQVDDLLKWIEKNQALAFDVETTDVDFAQLSLVGFGISNSKEGFFIPVAHKEIESLPYETIVKILLKISQCKTLIGHNLQFDIKCMAVFISQDLGKSRDFIDSLNNVFDTYYASFYLNQERTGGNGLKNLSRVLLHRDPPTLQQVLGKKPIEESDIETLADYCIHDCKNSFDLACIFSKELIRWEMDFWFSKHKMPLLKVLIKMELAGVRIDHDLILGKKDILRIADKQVEQEIRDICPDLVAFNKGNTKSENSKYIVDSPKRLGMYLFLPKSEGGLGLELVNRRTKSGEYDASEDHLSEIKDQHPVIEKILVRRTLRKIISTYIEGNEKQLTFNNFLYPQWKGAGVRTGRLACKNPNLMNWPAKSLSVHIEDAVESVNLRQFVIPNKGSVFWIADYSQLELRLLTHLTGEQTFIDALLEDLDPHLMVAGMMELLDTPELTELLGCLSKPTTDENHKQLRKKLFQAKNNIDKEELKLKSSKKDKKEIALLAKQTVLEPILGENWKVLWSYIAERRNEAKTIVYAVLYGATRVRIASELSISEDHAQLLIDKFYNGLTAIKTFTHEVHEFILRNGYQRTEVGTIRWLKGWDASPREKAEALRQGFNFRMQGLAMDIITIAMIRIDNHPELKKYGVRLLLQIHDELVVEIPEDYETRCPHVPDILAEIMSNPFNSTIQFKVPLAIDSSIKTKWSK